MGEIRKSVLKMVSSVDQFEALMRDDPDGTELIARDLLLARARYPISIGEDDVLQIRGRDLRTLYALAWLSLHAAMEKHDGK